jgi:DNA invertase Pin-like site-specific DNA recombinase
MSMADFVCAEYGDGRVVADKETRTRIREVGIREIARATKINRETVSLIANEGRVKPSTLARIVELFRNTA